MKVNLVSHMLLGKCDITPCYATFMHSDVYHPMHVVCAGYYACTTIGHKTNFDINLTGKILYT